MKIIADIVLGLQEQERECGSEAVQDPPRLENWGHSSKHHLYRVQQNALLQA